jgi:hypothetical protein
MSADAAESCEPDTAPDLSNLTDNLGLDGLAPALTQNLCARDPSG